jgi:hypothetical protein
MRELESPGRLDSGSSMKNFQSQSRHRLRPAPMRLHLGLPHFGHATLGTKARKAHPAAKAAPARRAPVRMILGMQGGRFYSQEC